MDNLDFDFKDTKIGNDVSRHQNKDSKEARIEELHGDPSHIDFFPVPTIDDTPKTPVSGKSITSNTPVNPTIPGIQDFSFDTVKTTTVPMEQPDIKTTKQDITRNAVLDVTPDGDTFVALDLRNMFEPDPDKETPLTASQVLGTFHRMRRTFAFNVAWFDRQLYIFFLLPHDMVSYAEDAVLGAYRFSEVRRNVVPVETCMNMQNMPFCTSMREQESYIYPLRLMDTFEDQDPLSAFTNAVYGMKLKNDDALIQFVINPLPPESWRKLMEKKEFDLKADPYGAGIKRLILPGLVGANNLGQTPMPQSISDDLRLLSEKKTSLPFGVNVNLYASTAERLRDVVASLSVLSGRNRLVIDDREKRRVAPYPPQYVQRSVVLSQEELSSAVHLPTAKVATPTLAHTKMKVLDSPAKMDPEAANTIKICDSYNRGSLLPLYLTDKDLCDNMLILGSSGSGKSTLMKSIAQGFVDKGWGFAAIDPKAGDLLKGLAASLKKAGREKDIVFFNPWNRHQTATLNLLAPYPNFRAENVASVITDSMRRVWAYSWGPRLDYILANAVKALVYINFWKMQEDPKRNDYYSLGDISEMYVNDDVFQHVHDDLEKYGKEEDRVTHGQSLITVEHQLDSRIKGILSKDSKWGDVISPLLNKIDRAATMSSGVELAIDTPCSSFNLLDLIGQNKCLLVSLPIDQDVEVTRVIGNIMLGLIFHTLQETSKKRVYPYGLFLDEMQNFAGTFVSKLYREGRSFKISTIGATQFLSGFQGQDQNETVELQGAITEAVGSLFQFRTQLPEKTIIEMFGEERFTPDDFSRLDTSYSYVNTHQNKSPVGPLVAFAPFVNTIEEENKAFTEVFSYNPSLYIPIEKLQVLNKEKVARRVPGQHASQSISDIKGAVKKMQTSMKKDGRNDGNTNKSGVDAVSEWLSTNVDPFSTQGIADLATRLGSIRDGIERDKKKKEEELKNRSADLEKKYDTSGSGQYAELQDVFSDMLGTSDDKTDEAKLNDKKDESENVVNQQPTGSNPAERDTQKAKGKRPKKQDPDESLADLLT